MSETSATCFRQESEAIRQDNWLVYFLLKFFHDCSSSFISKIYNNGGFVAYLEIILKILFLVKEISFG